MAKGGIKPAQLKSLGRNRAKIANQKSGPGPARKDFGKVKKNG